MLIIDHAYSGPPAKVSKVGVWRVSGLVDTWGAGGSVPGEGMEAPVHLPTNLVLGYFLSGCS